MATKHVVYPGDLAERIEQAADECDQSVSSFYKEAARRQLQQQESE